MDSNEVQLFIVLGHAQLVQTFNVAVIDFRVKRKKVEIHFKV